MRLNFHITSLFYPWKDTSNEMMKFFHLNVNTDYTHKIESGDEPDQLQTSNRPVILWMRERKSWCLAFFRYWFFGFLLTNAYIFMYVVIFMRKDTSKNQKPLCHMKLHVQQQQIESIVKQEKGARKAKCDKQDGGLFWKEKRTTKWLRMQHSTR